MADALGNKHPNKWNWIVVFVLAAVLMVWVGYHQYRNEAQFVDNECAENLASVGTLKANQIGEWRRERLADCKRFSQGPTMIRSARNFLANPEAPAAREDFHTILDLNRKAGFYYNAIATTREGVCLLAAEPLRETLADTTLLAIQTAAVTHEPAFSAIYRANDGRAVIDVAAPVADESGALICIFMLRCDASTYLYPLIRFWPTDSATSETLLARREGDRVVFLNDLRYGKQAALNLSFPLTRTDLPAAQAVLGTRGFFVGRDYKGAEVLSDLRPIPESDWFLITKIDRSEVNEALFYHGLVLARIVGLGVLLTGALFAVAYRRRQNLLYRHLYRVEKEQHEAHKRFETILYSIGDAVIVTDSHAYVRQMNPVAETLTGWKEPDAVGKPLQEIFRAVDENTREPIENPVWRVLREKRVIGLANHTILLSRAGTERPIADSGAPIRNAQGEIDGVVLVFRDQSSEHAAQRALLESERRLTTLLDNLPGVAYRCAPDAQWTMRFMSKGALELLGYSPEDLIGNARAAFNDLIHPSDREAVRAAINTAIALRQTFTLEYRILTRDRIEKWVWERGCAVLSPNNEVEALEGFITDITDIKESRKQQDKLELQLQQSQRIEAVGRLAGGVAHDFNNMLAVIMGNAELAIERLGGANPAAQELREIISAGKHSADLVKQLLAFARKQAIRPQVLNLNDTIAGMLSMLKRLIDEDIVLEWHPGAQLWSVKMDPSQIDQLLVNLIVNARDAISGTGTIAIETQNVSLATTLLPEEADTPTGDFVLVDVRDDGCGMDAETKAHIFEPFFTTKRTEVGTGLGLSTVYGIVKQNGGFIRVASAPERGSVFSIYLPRHDLEAGPHHELAAAPQAKPAGIGTILLVEDEPALLSLSTALVKKLGYTVLAAPGPHEALAMSAAYRGEIHVLMTDVVMPDMSGLDLWKRLVKDRPMLKSLYISGYTADIIANHGILEDDIAFLAKPFSKDALAQRLGDLFSSVHTNTAKESNA